MSNLITSAKIANIPKLRGSLSNMHLGMSAMRAYGAHKDMTLVKQFMTGI
jgi:hypothetical protein